MVATLREDEHSDVLYQKVLADAAMGRMSEPRQLTDEDIRTLVLSPRFSVEQGGSTVAVEVLRVGCVTVCAQASIGMANGSFEPSTTCPGLSSMKRRERTRS